MAAVLLMAILAGAGAYLAGGLRIGGRALSDILPVQPVRQAAKAALRPQTLDLLSRYGLELADRAVRLELSVADHLSVAAAVALSLPEDCLPLDLEIEQNRLRIAAALPDLATAQTFVHRLENRGLSPEFYDTAQRPDGSCVLYLSLVLDGDNLL